MLFANLIGIVCAACMAFAPAVSEFENNAVRAAENTSFAASPKMAYYDPAETYGNTGFVGYNYSSLTLYSPIISDDSPYAITGFEESYSWDSTHPVDIGFPTAVAGVSYYLDIMFDGGTIDTDKFGFEGLEADDSLDLYLDGDFVGNYRPIDYQGVFVFQIIIQSSVDLRDDDHYIWVFDHQETAPTNAGVEILGDIAEGITGGIVPVAEGIGSGLQSLVSNIFLDGDGLSTFGIVAICFAGLALAFGLSRWIVNFVSSLGARDR